MHAKKIAFLLLFVLFSADISGGETYLLKMRTGYHPDFLRIVLEGPESVISKAIVNQKARNVLVTFPETSFSLQPEKVVVAYNKVGSNTVLFSPGDFRGLKVFTLKNPSRLVIDVYQDTKEREGKAGFLRVRTIVIDPGHGGYEYGLVSDEFREKNVVLDIAKKIRALAGRDRTHAFLTRGSDRFLTLNERVTFTNDKDADVFLSLHIGNHKEIVLYTPVITESVPEEVKPYLVNKGQEEFITYTMVLLKAMKEAITSNFGADMVLIRPLPYSILSKIEAAALLVEMPSFEDAYYVEELKSEIAYTIYKGLYIYEENTAR